MIRRNQKKKREWNKKEGRIEQAPRNYRNDKEKEEPILADVEYTKEIETLQNEIKNVDAQIDIQRITAQELEN